MEFENQSRSETFNLNLVLICNIPMNLLLLAETKSWKFYVYGIVRSSLVSVLFE